MVSVPLGEATKNQDMNSTYKIKIFSLGASNEAHGPVLPSNTDDLLAKYISEKVARRNGYDYKTHIPFSSDRVGDIARDWNKDYTPMEEMTTKLIEFLRYFKSLKKNDNFSHIIIISGHGGNNFLKDEEQRISESVGVQTLYIPPLPDLQVVDDNHGTITPTHADDAEHSIGVYLDIVGKDGLRELNHEAKNNPLGVLKKWKSLMGLGGYTLTELDPEGKYQALREVDLGLQEMARTFLERKYVIADKGIGKKFVEGNIQEAEKRIKEFIESA